MQPEPLLSAGAPAHLQAFEAVQPMDAFLVVRPAFAPQHDPEAHVAKSRARLHHLADPHAATKAPSHWKGSDEAAVKCDGDSGSPSKALHPVEHFRS
jgi:hypothetical protein